MPHYQMHKNAWVLLDCLENLGLGLLKLTHELSGKVWILNHTHSYLGERWICDQTVDSLSNFRTEIVGIKTISLYFLITMIHFFLAIICWHLLIKIDSIY